MPSTKTDVKNVSLFLKQFSVLPPSSLQKEASAVNRNSQGLVFLA